jgi:predicted metal-dependent RNase
MQQTVDLLQNAEASYSIIASSGMCDYGRIVTILRYTLADPKTIVLQTGYASPGTRMWMMEHGRKQIPFDDSVGPIDLNADIRRMGGLSCHVDAQENIAHLKRLHDPAKGEQFKGIYIKHGEKGGCEALRNAIIRAGYDPATVHVMKKGETYTL